MTSGSDLQRSIVLTSTILVIVALVAGLAGGVFVVRSQPQQVRHNLAESNPGPAPGSVPSARPAGAGSVPSARPSGAGIVPSSAPSAAPPAGQCATPSGFSATSVRVGLARTSTPGPVVSFGLPLPPGAQVDAGAVRVSANGAPVAATTRVLLMNYSPDGTPKGARSILVQLPAAVMQGDCTEVAVVWQGGQAAAPTTPGPSPAPYTAVSAASDKVVDTATRTITSQGGKANLVETRREQRVLFTGREPAVLATFPAGIWRRPASSAMWSPMNRSAPTSPD